MIRDLTVVRFIDGSWSWGGKPDSPDYIDCEVFIIPQAKDIQSAVRKAQTQRRAKLAKAKSSFGATNANT
jgi:hypothetical protein